MNGYNGTGLETGLIKEILSSFGAPGFRIYTEEDREWAEGHASESPRIVMSSTGKCSDYLKDGVIQRYRKDSLRWERVGGLWEFGEKVLNDAMPLRIKNASYDRETHERLGDYLRAKRDVQGIDLMPLYNCFSDRTADRLRLTVRPGARTCLSQGPGSKRAIRFWSEDGYKIYAIPVRFFQEYWIAIDASQGLELCCGIWSGIGDSRSEGDPLSEATDPVKDACRALPTVTYMNVGEARFGKPFKFDKLTYTGYDRAAKRGDPYALSKDVGEFFWNCEEDLKLFIKVPFSNSSTITVLEGNYQGFGDRTIEKAVANGQARLKRVDNRYIANCEERPSGNDPLPSLEDRPFRPICRLYLLRGNTGVSHPYSPRLIEYLSGNAITPTDPCEDNFTRVQKAMSKNLSPALSRFKAKGVWEDKMRIEAYGYMTGLPPRHAFDGLEDAAKEDCLGYIDKDVENRYVGWDWGFRYGKDGKKIPETYFDSTSGKYKIRMQSGAALIRVTGDGTPLSTTETKDVEGSSESEIIARSVATTEATDEPLYLRKALGGESIANVDLYEGHYGEDGK